MEDLRLTILAKGIAIAAPSQPSANAAPLLPPARARARARLSKSGRFATAVLFGVNSGIGYLIMLAVMSYNGGVMIAVVLGLAVGYFFFRAKDYEALVLEDACACS